MTYFKSKKAAAEAGKALKQKREALGIFAKEVGEHFSKSERTIYRWEEGLGLTFFFAKEYENFLAAKSRQKPAR